MHCTISIHFHISVFDCWIYSLADNLIDQRSLVADFDLLCIDYLDLFILFLLSFRNLLGKLTIQEPTFDRIIVVYRYSFLFSD